MEVSAGAKAPPFKRPRDGGGFMSLADFKARKLNFSRQRPTPRALPANSLIFQGFAPSARRPGTAPRLSADSGAAQDKLETKNDLAHALEDRKAPADGRRGEPTPTAASPRRAHSLKINRIGSNRRELVRR